MCVGQSETAALPPNIQALADAGVFAERLCIPDMPNTPDQYWCHVLASLSENVDKALVVPIDVDATLDILRVGAQLREGVACCEPSHLVEVAEEGLPNSHPEDLVMIAAHLVQRTHLRPRGVM